MLKYEDDNEIDGGATERASLAHNSRNGVKYDVCGQWRDNIYKAAAHTA